MTTTQRTFVEPTTASPDEAGWRFTPTPESTTETNPATPKKLPSLSWRLRH